MESILFLLLAGLYLLPTVVAVLRKHHNAGGIFLLNLLLGWTFIGWVIAIVWSATAVQRREEDRKHRPQDGGVTVTLTPEQAAKLGLGSTGADDDRSWTERLRDTADSRGRREPHI